MDKLANIPMDYLIAGLALVFFLGLIAFVIAAGVLAGALKNIKGLLSNAVEQRDVRIPNQPVGVAVHGPISTREHTEFATREELAQHLAEDDAVHLDLRDQIKAVDQDITSFRAEVSKNGDERRKSIEGKVETARTEASTNFGTLNREMGGVKTALELLAKQVEKIADHQANAR